jgi:hypothetical protein
MNTSESHGGFPASRRALRHRCQNEPCEQAKQREYDERRVRAPARVHRDGQKGDHRDEQANRTSDRAPVSSRPDAPSEGEQRDDERPYFA